MNLFVSLILSLAILGSLALYWRMRWRILLPASAVFFLALLAYNSVRGFANLAVDKEYLAELASTRPELQGYVFDPEDLIRASRPPLDFNASNGNFDRVIDIVSDHPWHRNTGFIVDSQWLTKENRVVSVLYRSSGRESEYFSGFSWGQGTLPLSGRLMSRISMQAYRNE